MVAGEENLWFLDTLKCSISELILPKKTWKGKKTAFLKIEVTTFISELLTLGVGIMASHSALCYENLPDYEWRSKSSREAVSVGPATLHTYFNSLTNLSKQLGKLATT